MEVVFINILVVLVAWVLIYTAVLTALRRHDRD